ncbi:MAG: GNAT family N-acetyltransferase [Dehalococcoidia bacterium]
MPQRGSLVGDIEVTKIRTPAEMEEALTVRRRVFIDEQGVPEDEEIDRYDEDPASVTGAVQVLGRLDGVPVATGRLLLDTGDRYPHVGRIAVLAEHRRSGFGRAIMDALHAEARARGLPGITLAAQLHAVPFYERLGYVARGEVFLDAGIDHRWMDITL